MLAALLLLSGVVAMVLEYQLSSDEGFSLEHSRRSTVMTVSRRSWVGLRSAEWAMISVVLVIALYTELWESLALRLGVLSVVALVCIALGVVLSRVTDRTVGLFATGSRLHLFLPPGQRERALKLSDVQSISAIPGGLEVKHAHGSERLDLGDVDASDIRRTVQALNDRLPGEDER